jgi:sugar phosphate isomerase/epimerase
MKKEILPLGVIIDLSENPLRDFEKVKELGFSTCQIGNPPDEYIYGRNAKKMTADVKRAIKKTGISVSSVFIIYKGHIWDTVDGPLTIGLVPENTRAVRAVHSCRVSNWAKQVGIKVVTSHVGFIPNDFLSPLYKGFMDTMKAFVEFCASNKQIFAFETGQEPAYVLRKVIDDIRNSGLKNVGVNLDPANLLLYGMGRPMEAVEILGEFIINTHCKDGKMLIQPDKLGKEMPIGQGDVHFEELIPELYKKGFRGPLTIEREISGEQQIKDILIAKEYLEKIKQKMFNTD